ncbi:MAG: hemerythrin family protein [Desulfomonile tiedjei]|uniref:Hemerythrin family protein n=1 Tax=Desulfomonile tiedjei TaxID=2358 RepID=A0A9D6V384_9BACT|nr:hemerythrin family protein [Desulfomonile tiedjei]
MPVYFAWKPALSVFVEAIDNQHKELYRRLDRFMDSVLRGEGKQEVGQILKFLIDYCVVHFGTEELYMEKHGYPGYPAHKKAHERLTLDVLNIQRQIEEGITSQHIISLINQLGDWVTEHIEKMDKELGAYLGIAQGESPASLRGALPLRHSDGFTDSSVEQGERACGHLGECSMLFQRFRDPESSKFWKTRYCVSSRCTDCERKKLIDRGTQAIDVPITLLPDGQHLQSLAQYP